MLLPFAVAFQLLLMYFLCCTNFPNLLSAQQSLIPCSTLTVTCPLLCLRCLQPSKDLSDGGDEKAQQTINWEDDSVGFVDMVT